jgi:hypothetical protein
MLRDYIATDLKFNIVHALATNSRFFYSTLTFERFMSLYSENKKTIFVETLSYNLVMSTLWPLKSYNRDVLY